MRTSIITRLFLFFNCCLFITACEDHFLDRSPDDKLDEEQVFTRYSQVNRLVTDLYSHAKAANRPLVFFNHFSSSAITDECEGNTAEKDLANNFNRGGWSSMGMPENSSCGQYWWNLYAFIRQCNVILEGIAKYNTPDNVLQPGDLYKRTGEVFFIRAYLHYLAARMYGEIPYVDHTISASDNMVFYKNSFHTVVEKILADCDSAISRVPDVWGGVDFGRIDKGAVLGLKAMTQWMAATPLWNGGDFPNDTRIFRNEYAYKPERWETAKVAAKKLINYQVNGKPRFDLYRGHDATDFNDDAGLNLNNSKVYARLWDMYYSMEAYKSEVVFVVTKDKNQAWQSDVYPPSRGGSSRQMPVQEQVDEYEYVAPNGYGYPVYAFRAASDGYDDSNPYESVQRDPRFYRDIVYHGSAFRDNSNHQKIVNLASGVDKIGAFNSTTTGYFLRKLIKESWNRSGTFDIHGPPIWRLPHFIYIYCEAVNETTGPVREIYDMINAVRARSFMAPMPPETMTSKELMNEYIQRERRVELFYENDRIWRCRLYLEPSSVSELSKETAWKAAGTDNNSRSKAYWPYPKCQRMINGMRPVEDPNGKIIVDGVKYRMERFWIEDRVFVSPRHYLFPIMDDELKRCPTLVQNPGW